MPACSSLSYAAPMTPHALLLVRLLAIFCAALALGRVAAAVSAPLPAAVEAGSWALAGLLLWVQAPRLAQGLSATGDAPAGDRDPRRMDALLFAAAGLLLAAHALAAGAGLLLASWLASPAVWPWPALLAAVLQLAAGLGLLLASRRLAARLLPPPAPIASTALDTRLPRALGELIGSVGIAGINKLTELALTLKDEAEGRAIQAVKSSMDAVIAAVQGRRPDFSGALSADGTVTIAFSDMEGFSAMTERLGDREAHEVIKLHNQVVRKELQRENGKEVELQGDGFLLAFADPAAALRCAIGIQRAFARHNAGAQGEPIHVRIGLHTGTPIQEGDRFFGITVILAARIAAQAGGGEVLASAALHERCAGDPDFRFGEAREAELKGLAGRHRMHPLLWQRTDSARSG
jgi:class 3 adenylate cyclase